MKRSIAVVACLATACLFATAVQAQTTTYDYTGAPMSGTEYVDTTSINGPQFTPYCCASFDGTMTLTSPLAPNLNNALVNPTALTFSLAPLAGQVGGLLNSSGYYSGSSNVIGIVGLSGTVNISTNSAGQITGWNLDLGTVQGLNTGWNGSITSAGDSVEYQAGTHGPYYGGCLEACGPLSTSVAGDWSIQSGAATAPEINPGGVVPGITMLLGLMAVARGWRRRSVGLAQGGVG